MSWENLWAGWRSAYVSTVAAGESPEPVETVGDREGESCVFCRILASSAADEVRHVVHAGELTTVLLNAFPYATGHVLVMPIRHVGDLGELETAERDEMWSQVTDTVAALRSAYKPDGFNVGMNLGRAAGAGIPGHLHVHVMPRWVGDTNFMTAAAGVRVMPETLEDTWRKLRDNWEGRS